MGDIIRVVCDCGYQAGKFFEGVGMNPDGPVVELTSCTHCREVIAVNVLAQRHRCPRCRRAVATRLRSREDWMARSGAPALQCPKCEQRLLQFELVGAWD